MYERFTDRGRKVMQLANQAAQRFRHEYIGTEHVLLGLTAEGSGVAANVLKNLDIDLQRIQQEVEKIVQPGPEGEQIVMGRLPQTPRTKKVIEYAIEEARSLHHNYVGTEHLLLGLLREKEGIAARVLMNLGLKLEDVREEVLNLLGHNTPKDDVFHIPKNLSAVEPYSVSGTAPVPDHDTTKAGTAPTVPPDLTAAQLLRIKVRIRILNEKKGEFLKALDFGLAEKCADEADGLARLLMWYEWRHKPH